MDFESEFSVLQSIVHNELIFPEESGNLGENETNLKINGANSVEDVNNKLRRKVNVPFTGVVSPSVTVASFDGNESSSSIPAADKRRELKKWRRIPRVPAIDSIMKNEMNHSHEENSVLPDFHQRNGRIGPEKKARGVEIVKENSNSTIGIIGSDCRSSNFVFVQGDNTAAKKDKSGAFMKSIEESGDENEEAKVDFIKSYAESDDVSLAADDIKEHEGSMEHDPLEESIKDLHIAQEEFETEVQKWRDVGEDDPSILNDPVSEIIELKDAKILELELALSSGGIKNEVDDWLMKIIQADVEHLVITASTKRLIEGPLPEIKHNLQQKNVLLHDLEATKKQDWNLETKENLKKLQSRVCRFTSCFVIQLIILLAILYLKFSPQKVVIVPT